MGSRILLSVLTVLLSAASLAAAPVTVEPPVTVAVTVVEEPRNRRVVGEMAAYDEVGVTVVVNGERRRFAWADLTPASSFTARHRTVDEADPRAWLDLARFGRLVGAERQSEYAIKKALLLDRSLEAEAEAVREVPLGELRQAGVSETGATEIDPTDEAEAEIDAIDLPAGWRPPASDPALPPKFADVNQGFAQQAERAAMRWADEDLRRSGIRMRLVETPHFLIFTDWDPVDDRWLAEQLEGAYALLSREFNVGGDQTVFVGRLPVYMFHSQEAMLHHARASDGFDGGDGVAAYYTQMSNGLGKLTMSKPRATQEMGLDEARRMWSRTLVHEFVHAFLSRYRGNGALPRWLNEGLAEMLAETIHPRPMAFEHAKHVAQSGEPLADLFDDARYPGAIYYPVMMSMAHCLYHQDPATFVRMVDRIKAGQPAEEALRQFYGVDYAGLEAAWRDFMLRHPGP